MKKSKPQDYQIGRNRPPKDTRWRKGQCGNPKRIRRRKSLDVAKLIEKAFSKKIKVTEGGVRTVKTAFEVIIMQLWIKAAKGSARASRVLFRYQDFAVQKGGVTDLVTVYASE